ncbi:hypothetical protein HQ487_01370 [Candidatus Uhrbacteria bacterium]|nr:hypothetical protein [Candidatus Uhrbacteria bacterium]
MSSIVTQFIVVICILLLLGVYRLLDAHTLTHRMRLRAHAIFERLKPHMYGTNWETANGQLDELVFRVLPLHLEAMEQSHQTIAEWYAVGQHEMDGYRSTLARSKEHDPLTVGTLDRALSHYTTHVARAEEILSLLEELETTLLGDDELAPKRLPKRITEVYQTLTQSS